MTKHSRDHRNNEFQNTVSGNNNDDNMGVKGAAVHTHSVCEAVINNYTNTTQVTF